MPSPSGMSRSSASTARTHWQVNHPNTYIDSGYSFNLGFAFPTALGVKVAQPDRPVLCMAGDGEFHVQRR